MAEGRPEIHAGLQADLTAAQREIERIREENERLRSARRMTIAAVAAEQQARAETAGAERDKLREALEADDAMREEFDALYVRFEKEAEARQALIGILEVIQAESGKHRPHENPASLIHRLATDTLASTTTPAPVDDEER